MSEFTAEDFARASFARHEDGGKAVRFDVATDRLQWQIGKYGVASDEGMARGGWVPVVEASEVMQHRQIDAEAHLDQIARLSRRVAKAEDHAAVAEEVRRDAQRDLDDARATITDLTQEVDRLERILQAPLSLKDLQAAWEAAEVPTGDDPIRGGDVIIYQHDGGQWSVREVEPHEHDDDDWSCSVRILSRAPKREPWQDLADVLGDFAIHDKDGDEYPGLLAQMLYERGVRVTGGDE